MKLQNSDKWRVTSDEKGNHASAGIAHRSLRITHHSAFTLAEVLAALLFMAIVIPVAIEALHVASLGGEVAARKGEAARVADRILNQALVETNWNAGSQNGTTAEGSDNFSWTLSSANWPPDSMQLVTAEVTFTAQGHNYSVKMSTLANLQNQNSPATSSQP